MMAVLSCSRARAVMWPKSEDVLDKSASTLFMRSRSLLDAKKWYDDCSSSSLSLPTYLPYQSQTQSRAAIWLPLQARIHSTSRLPFKCC